MPWILKKFHTFNDYIGENGIVKCSSEAKEFSTRKAAEEYRDNSEHDLEILTKTKKK